VARRLFGTDGVRGVAGEVVTADLAIALGRAAARECETNRPQVLIVRDTRESGGMLEAALAAGVAQGGGDAYLGGVLPTPAASVLVRRQGLDLAAAITASHNPWPDNGIKLFGPDGRKLADEVERAIEARIDDRAAAGSPAESSSSEAPAVGRIRTLEGARDDYLRELARAFRIDLSGRRVLLDCANGATYRTAPEIFARLGAEVESIGTDPDGRNINEGCGSTSPDALVERITGSVAEIGFAFDGDGDRVLAIDASGAVRDGDELLALCARHLREGGQLDGGVAVTVMTNHGFHRAMEDAGVEVATTPVGDRHVIAALAERGWTLGGEQSGHLIWTEVGPTGDGIAAALLVMRALDGRSLAEVAPMQKLPQHLTNIPVRDRDALADARALWDAVEREEARLGDRGRILIRASGTEPLVRVMVEAPEASECEEICNRLAAIVEKELG
jgi:phosphoglucosamine mutase